MNKHYLMPVMIVIVGIAILIMSKCKKEEEEMIPRIDVMPKILEFGSDIDELVVKVFNLGEGSLNWNIIDENAGWLNVIPAFGTLNDNKDTAYLHISVERGSVNPGSYSEFFYFRNQNNLSDTIRISAFMNILEPANLFGYVFFANTKIPISGVMVSVSDQSSLSGNNGYYEIQNITSGEHVITASKENFDDFVSNINISSGINAFPVVMTSGVYTHKLYGTITYATTGTPLANASIIILNPDGSESQLKAESNETGYYQIEKVPEGEITVRFIYPEFEILEKSIIMPGNDYQLDTEINDACDGIQFVDYEGITYSTILIGTQCWFKKNLDVGMMISASGNQYQEDNGIIEKFCYQDDVTNCSVYGGLYQWNEMMNYTTQEGNQGICPSGWHIPSDNDWNILIGYLGGVSVAGGKLKEAGTLHWNSPNTGATNVSDFTALPGGDCDGGGGFYGQGNIAHFWSSYGSNNWAYYRLLLYDREDVLRDNMGKVISLSVRCIKD